MAPKTHAKPMILTAALALALALPLAAGLAGSADAQGADRMGPRAAPDLATIDTDGDGVISEAEFDALRSGELAGRAFAERMIAEHDADGDGMISAEELAAAAEEMRGMHGPRGGDRAERAGRMFEALDVDSDGMISREEFASGAARMQDGRERMKDRMEARRGDGDRHQRGPRMHDHGDGRGPARN
jgi:hypothetical protein